MVLSRKYRASFRHQLRALSGRSAANARRHPGLIAVNWGATFVVAAGLGAHLRFHARPSPAGSVSSWDRSPSTGAPPSSWPPAWVHARSSHQDCSSVC